MHERDWRRPTSLEDSQWAYRASLVLPKINIIENYPFQRRYFPSDNYDWKIMFTFEDQKLTKHSLDRIGFKTTCDFLLPALTKSADGDLLQLVRVISTLMGEVPNGIKSKFNTDINNLMRGRAHALVRVHHDELTNFIKRLSDEYEQITGKYSLEEIQELVLKKKAKNEKTNARAFKKRFEQYYPKVIESISNLAIETNSEDDVHALSLYVEIINTSLLDILLAFRKGHHATLRYLDKDRIEEACKLALAKKTLEQ